MKRVVVPELLDQDAGTPAEIDASLADLRWLNAWFGGWSTTTALLWRIAKERGLCNLSYLDVAGASADGAQAARDSLKHRGVEMEAAVLDRSHRHLPRGRSPHASNGIAVVCGDALALPFADNSFDICGASLFAHHLEPDELIAFAEEALRVCRVAVILNDLRRSRLHLATAIAGRLLYRSRITRHDSAASVRRAYTCEELAGIFARLRGVRIEITRHYFFRAGVVLWKPLS